MSVTTFHAAAVVGPVGGAREVGVLVLLWVLTALLYPRLEAGIGWFVDTVILHRPDYATVIARVARLSREEQDVTALLDRTCSDLAPALSARTVRWEEIAANARVGSGEPTTVSAAVTIPATETPQYALRVGDLMGGRRLLSDDYAALQSIASILGRRIDAIRLTRERYARQIREQEMSKLATEAELRALRIADQPALPVQRADDHRLPHPDGARSGARDPAEADIAAAWRAAVGRRIHNARARARDHRVVPGHRARAIRGPTGGAHRCARRRAERANSAAARPADCRKRGQAWHRSAPRGRRSQPGRAARRSRAEECRCWS